MRGYANNTLERRRSVPLRIVHPAIPSDPAASMRLVKWPKSGSPCGILVVVWRPRCAPRSNP